MRGFGVILIVLGCIDILRVMNTKAIAATMNTPYIGLEFGPMMFMIGACFIVIGLYFNLRKEDTS